MGAGVVLNFACVAVALSGQDLHQFLVALFLLGVGWNFLFTGATTLSMEAYRPEEKDKAQAAINFVVFAVMAFPFRLGRAGDDAGLESAQRRLDRAARALTATGAGVACAAAAAADRQGA